MPSEWHDVGLFWSTEIEDALGGKLLDGGKVLNVEWSDNDEAIVVGYKPGLWEQELERLAAAAI